jgi:FtsH-binding integral membrane protein
MSQTNALTAFQTRKQDRIESGYADQISSRTYNAIMCGTLLWGFLANVLMVAFLAAPVMNLAMRVGPLWLFVGYIVLALVGIMMSARSSSPVVSFIGFNLLVLPMGVMLCLLVPGLPVAVVTKALLLTGIVTATMVLLGIVQPNLFLSMGRTLFIAFIAAFIAELVATFLFHYNGTAFDWIFVILFSGYIGYDVAKAQIYPKTVDFAIDCALDIYIDIIGLFIRLLSLLSREN